MLRSSVADVNTVLDVNGEMFDVRESEPSSRVHAYHFTWTNGPEDGTYGFSLGSSDLTAEQLERAARSFVQSFFAPDGLGASDFLSFVEDRRSSQ